MCIRYRNKKSIIIYRMRKFVVPQHIRWHFFPSSSPSPLLVALYYIPIYFFFSNSIFQFTRVRKKLFRGQIFTQFFAQDMGEKIQTIFIDSDATRYCFKYSRIRFDFLYWFFCSPLHIYKLLAIFEIRQRIHLVFVRCSNLGRSSLRIYFGPRATSECSSIFLYFLGIKS